MSAEGQVRAWPLWTFVCPLTNSILQDPVIADDGLTYSKQALLEYFEDCKRRKVAITSPSTREEMSDSMLPNSGLAKEIEKYRNETLLTTQITSEKDSQSYRPISVAKSAQTSAPKSLSVLGTMFSMLDGLRDLLAEALDGWQPPQIIVLGQENSGKSSVLERLMMTPILPRDEDICTRLPIHVRLRRSSQAAPPRLEIYNTKTKKTERGPYVISAQSGAVDVSEEMRNIVTTEQGSLSGVSSDRIIVLHISNPDVPFLDLVDMPGIVTAPSANEPDDMASQTMALVNQHVQSERGNSLYLAVVKATSAPNASLAMQVLHDANLYRRTFGVFTFCDEIAPKQSRRLQGWICDPSAGRGAVSLEPYGWVATSNAPPEDELGNVIQYTSNLERLQAQADAEVDILRQIGLGDLVDQEFASHSALVSRLNRMYLDHLKHSWAPNTLRKIFSEQRKVDIEDALLGMPPAPGFYKEGNARANLEKKLAEARTRLPNFDGIAEHLAKHSETSMQLNGESILLEMKNKIRAAIEASIDNTLPKTWSRPPAHAESEILSSQHKEQVREWLAEDPEYGGKDVKLHLLYRGSRDGWEPSQFHSRCDNKGPTVTVIKTTAGYLFGGYADLSWTSANQYQSSPRSFLFSLLSPSGTGAVKMPSKGGRAGISCFSDQGPTFGCDCRSGYGSYSDICIQGKNCSCNPSGIQAFQLPPGQCSTLLTVGFMGGDDVCYPRGFIEKAAFKARCVNREAEIRRTFLAGNFSMVEIEVLQVAASVENFLLNHCVPLASFDQAFDLEPDIQTRILKVCEQALEEDTCFWVQEVRTLCGHEVQNNAPLLSSAASDLLDKPPIQITRRFPALVDSLVTKVKEELKPLANDRILEAVTRSLERFRLEALDVDRWNKQFTLDGVHVKALPEDRVSTLTNDVLLAFLRYNSAMLRNLGSIVPALLECADLREACAQERLRLMAERESLLKAQEGIFNLLDINTAQDKEAWKLKFASSAGPEVDAMPSKPADAGSVADGMSTMTGGDAVSNYTTPGHLFGGYERHHHWYADRSWSSANQYNPRDDDSDDDYD